MAEALLFRCGAMEDLSLHILDIVENSFAAGATEIEITIREEIRENRLTVSIKDNGAGMDENTVKKAMDPFYTTKNTRRIGLGLSMLAQAAQEADGSCTIRSILGKGTIIIAHFAYDHIDRKPIGNMAETIAACLVSYGARTDIKYRHYKNGAVFVFDTREVRKEINGAAINTPEVVSILKRHIEKGLREIGQKE
jgi:hypothetical protein